MTSNGHSLQATMKALRYEKPLDYSIVEVPLPIVGNRNVLVRIEACGVCGTDLHIHEGDLLKEFPAKYPLIPGHEVVGTVAQLGKDTTRFTLGQRVVCSANVACHDCFFCARGEPLLCENMRSHGVTVNGGFAEYCAYSTEKVHAISLHLSDLEAILIEPAACAAQMLASIAPAPGSACLVFGAGPAGMLLAQLLRLNGGCSVTLASLPGAKLDTARALGVADAYVELGAGAGGAGLEAAARAGRGFDVVVEATGVSGVLEDSLGYVRRGGTLAAFGVYSSAVRVSWSPAMILGNQIRVVGSVAEVMRFPAAVDYLNSGRVMVTGVANRVFRLEQWAECLAALKDPGTVKAAVVFDWQEHGY